MKTKSTTKQDTILMNKWNCVASCFDQNKNNFNTIAIILPWYHLILIFSGQTITINFQFIVKFISVLLLLDCNTIKIWGIFFRKFNNFSSKFLFPIFFFFFLEPSVCNNQNQQNKSNDCNIEIPLIRISV